MHGTWSHGLAEAFPRSDLRVGRKTNIKWGNGVHTSKSFTGYLRNLFNMTDVKDEKNITVEETNGNGEYVPTYTTLSQHDDSEVDSFLASDRKLVRKIDFHLLPWICLLYALGLLDRYYLIPRILNLIAASISVLPMSLVWVKSWP